MPLFRNLSHQETTPLVQGATLTNRVPRYRGEGNSPYLKLYTAHPESELGKLEKAVRQALFTPNQQECVQSAYSQSTDKDELSYVIRSNMYKAAYDEIDQKGLKETFKTFLKERQHGLTDAQVVNVAKLAAQYCKDEFLNSFYEEWNMSNLLGRLNEFERVVHSQSTMAERVINGTCSECGTLDNVLGFLTLAVQQNHPNPLVALRTQMPLLVKQRQSLVSSRQKTGREQGRATNRSNKRRSFGV